MTERPTIHRNSSRAAHLLVVFVIGILVVMPVVGEGDPIDASLDSEARYDPAVYEVGWLTADRDDDGTVDYAVRVDDFGNKLSEAVDFNRDGWMDDFYFYANDVLQRQEVDSNFDQAIDIWIYMWRGVYVQKWERDTDYDGSVDVSRDYDQPR